MQSLRAMRNKWYNLSVEYVSVDSTVFSAREKAIEEEDVVAICYPQKEAYNYVFPHLYLIIQDEKQRGQKQTQKKPKSGT